MLKESKIASHEDGGYETSLTGVDLVLMMIDSGTTEKYVSVASCPSEDET